MSRGRRSRKRPDRCYTPDTDDAEQSPRKRRRLLPPRPKLITKLLPVSHETDIPLQWNLRLPGQPLNSPDIQTLLFLEYTCYKCGVRHRASSSRLPQWRVEEDHPPRIQLVDYSALINSQDPAVRDYVSRALDCYPDPKALSRHGYARCYICPLCHSQVLDNVQPNRSHVTEWNRRRFMEELHVLLTDLGDEKMMVTSASLMDVMIHIVGKKLYREQRVFAKDLEEPTLEDLGNFDIVEESEKFKDSGSILSALLKEFVAEKEKVVRKSKLLEKDSYRLLALQLQQSFVRLANQKKNTTLSYTYGFLIDLLTSSDDAVNALNHVGITPCASRIRCFLEEASKGALDIAEIFRKFFGDFIYHVVWDNIQKGLGTSRSSWDRARRFFRVFTNICLVKGGMRLGEIDETMFRTAWQETLLSLKAEEVLPLPSAEKKLYDYQNATLLSQTACELSEINDTVVTKDGSSELVERFESKVLALESKCCHTCSTPAESAYSRTCQSCGTKLLNQKARAKKLIARMTKYRTELCEPGGGNERVESSAILEQRKEAVRKSPLLLIEGLPMNPSDKDDSVAIVKHCHGLRAKRTSRSARQSQPIVTQYMDGAPLANIINELIANIDDYAGTMVDIGPFHEEKEAKILFLKNVHAAFPTFLPGIGWSSDKQIAFLLGGKDAHKQWEVILAIETGIRHFLTWSVFQADFEDDAPSLPSVLSVTPDEFREFYYRTNEHDVLRFFWDWISTIRMYHEATRKKLLFALDAAKTLFVRYVSSRMCTMYMKISTFLRIDKALREIHCPRLEREIADHCLLPCTSNVDVRKHQGIDAHCEERNKFTVRRLKGNPDLATFLRTSRTHSEQEIAYMNARKAARIPPRRRASPKIAVILQSLAIRSLLRFCPTESGNFEIKTRRAVPDPRHPDKMMGEEICVHGVDEVKVILDDRAVSAVEQMRICRIEGREFSINKITYSPITFSPIVVERMNVDGEDGDDDAMAVDGEGAGEREDDQPEVMAVDVGIAPHPNVQSRCFLTGENQIIFGTILRDKCVCGRECESDHGVAKCMIRTCKKFFMDGPCGVVVCDGDGEMLFAVCRACLQSARCLECERQVGAIENLDHIRLCLGCYLPLCPNCGEAGKGFVSGGDFFCSAKCQHKKE